MYPTTHSQRSRFDAVASDLDLRLVAYAARIGRLVEQLPDTRAGKHAAGQLLQSGMSPLPVLGAAGVAGSKDELIGELRACLRSLEECRRWLRFILHVPLIQPTDEADLLLSETESLVRVFAARLWKARCEGVQRWRLRHPAIISRRPTRHNFWTAAKGACGRLWRGETS